MTLNLSGCEIKITWLDIKKGVQGRFVPKICAYLQLARVEAVKKLGVIEFLNPDKEFRGTDALVIAFAERVLKG